MISIRRFATIASLFTCLALGSSAAAFADAAPVPAAADAGMRPHGHGHHGRHGDLVRASLHLDSLSTSQRQQIEALVQSEKTAHANIASARSELLKAVAAKVASGSVDDVALTPNVQAVEGAIQADEPGDRAALEQLHTILSAAQRVELVTKLQGRGLRGEHHREGDAGARGGHEGGMWARELNLSDAQKQQIEVNLRSIGPAPDKAIWREARESRNHVLEAFKGDRFVMKEVAPSPDPRIIDQGVERIVRVAKASAPVLTPQQRAIASAKLQEMAAHSMKK